jgi:CrcB protein
VSVLLMALAGACGAVARFLVDGAVTSRRTTTFPWATFGINVTGSFVLGLLAGAFADPGSWWRLVVGVGFCGGYTTFSTASMETVRLVQRARLRTRRPRRVGRRRGRRLVAYRLTPSPRAARSTRTSQA